MTKYEIATFIVCFINGFICYLIGYRVGITHDKRMITHECVKDTHDKTEPQIEYKKWETKPTADMPTEITTCVSVAMALVEDEPQTEGAGND